MAELQRAASTRARLLKAQFRQAERRNYPQKRKTRPGGQPDGSSHMGALGVDGRSRRIQPRWGGITAPTDIVSREGRSTFKRTWDFFKFLAGDFGRKTSARRADRLRQRPTYRTPWRQGGDSERRSGERPAGLGRLHQ